MMKSAEAIESRLQARGEDTTWLRKWRETKMMMAEKDVCVEPEEGISGNREVGEGEVLFGAIAVFRFGGV